MIKMFLLLSVLLSGLLACGADTEIPELSGAGLEWKLPPFAKRSGDILTVEVPETNNAAGQNVAFATIDLTPYRGERLYFSIEARAVGVSKPPQTWNGIKFMLNYLPTGGTERWHHPSGLYGSFDWKPIAFSCGVDNAAGNGKLLLGLQDSSGKVEFNLATLKVYRTRGMVNTTYQVRYPASTLNRPTGRGVMSPHTCTEEDFKTLKQWNVNLMRMQLTRFWGEAGTDRDLAEYDRWLNGKLDHLEQCAEWAQKYGVKLIIDLHSPPGGRDRSMDMTMFYDDKYANHFLEVWKRIAGRFKGNPAIWGYDLVNEPVQSHPAKYDYWTLQKMAAEAVRAIDPETPIIIESNEWDSPNAFSYLSPLAMDNVIYQVHMYVPGGFTHQGVGNNAGVESGARRVAYPGMVDGTNWNIEEIRKALKPVREFAEKHNARIYVGEFSAIAWAPGAEKYLEDCISVFEENNWDWTYHAFREWDGWSVEHAGPDREHLAPAADTPRKRVLLDAFSKNKPRGE